MFAKSVAIAGLAAVAAAAPAVQNDWAVVYTSSTTSVKPVESTTTTKSAEPTTWSAWTSSKPVESTSSKPVVPTTTAVYTTWSAWTSSKPAEVTSKPVISTVTKPVYTTWSEWTSSKPAVVTSKPVVSTVTKPYEDVCTVVIKTVYGTPVWSPSPAAPTTWAVVTGKTSSKPVEPTTKPVVPTTKVVYTTWSAWTSSKPAEPTSKTTTSTGTPKPTGWNNWSSTVSSTPRPTGSPSPSGPQCGVVGYDNNSPIASVYSKDASALTKAGCFDLCAADDSCKSFAVSSTACYGYTSYVSDNFKADDSSPNTFYDLDCETPEETEEDEGASELTY